MMSAGYYCHVMKMRHRPQLTGLLQVTTYNYKLIAYHRKAAREDPRGQSPGLPLPL